MVVSLYGLEASTGVAAELFAMRGYSTEWSQIQLSPQRSFMTCSRQRDHPDKALGRAAFSRLEAAFFPWRPRRGLFVHVGGIFGKSEARGAGRRLPPIWFNEIAAFVVLNSIQAYFSTGKDRW
jgi:hypothetical protein